ncbi:MAG: chorismate--pyruvate lyase [Saprospiraceae bacterium]|jgi:chorismate--pyruvate lyase
MNSNQAAVASSHNLLPLQEPDWIRSDAVASPLFTDVISHWLLDANSLTDRLRVMHAEHFNLQLLSWQQALPLASECTLLKVSDAHNVWVREVVLCNGQTPLIFARSVITGNDASLMQTLNGLGKESLGGYLFNSPNVIRGEMQIARVTNDMLILEPFLAAGLPLAEGYWARRCLYQIGLARLLVNEIYSPSVF